MSRENLLYGPSTGILAKLRETGIEITDQTFLEISGSNHNDGFLSCYAQSYSNEPATSFIPFKTIIWSEPISLFDKELLEVTYVYRHNESLGFKKLQLLLEPVGESLDIISQTVLSKAYGESHVRPSILLLINPHGGQGKAVQIYKSKVEPILKAAKVSITYKETTHSEHAVEIARELDIDEYDIIACCSGDGIPHEVINGFHSRPDKGATAFNKIAMTQLPCGTGNALSLSTHGSNDASIATFNMLKAKKTKLDLMTVTQGKTNEVTKLSFLSQCYGVIADSDIGTEYLRWMGPIRFDLGIAYRVLTREKFPCDLYVKYVTDSQEEIVQHFDRHRAGNPVGDSVEKLLKEEDFELKGPKLNEEVPSDWQKLSSGITDNLSVFYVGKLPYISDDVQFFPAALPNDGAMDMIITNTKTSIGETLETLSLTKSGQHVHNNKLIHAKILSYRLVPRMPSQNHYISVDGESFPFEPLQVEVLPGVLTCLLQDGRFVDTCFSK